MAPLIPPTNPRYTKAEQIQSSTFTPNRFANSQPPVLFDIPCPDQTDGNPVCACQINCGDPNKEPVPGRPKLPAPCPAALELCAATPGCTPDIIESNPQKTWSTLKRPPSDEYMALFEWEGMSYTQAGVDAMFSEEEKRATGVNPNADVAKLLRTANWPADKAFATRDDAMCHGGPDSGYRPANPVGSFAEIASKKIAVVGLSMQTPATLFNSVMSWDRSGLLDLAHERMLLLNSPHPAELAVGYDYGFRVVQPRDIPGVKMNPSRDNVVTIGAAFYYSLTLVESDYIIFLEKDFMADYTLGKEGFARQIAAAIQMLEEGAWIVRMRSRSQQGCDSFKDCGKGNPDWQTTNLKNRRKNHWQFYCDGFEDLPGAKDIVAECLDEPSFRCHTSYDSNWSLNAVIVKKDVMLKETPKGPGGASFGSIGAFGLKTYDAQDGMEVRMGDENWYRFKVPICISTDGAFFHAEIDG